MQSAFLPLDLYYYSFPGINLLPNGFGLLAGRLTLNGLALLSTLKGHPADGILDGGESATSEQQWTEQPYTAPGASAEPSSGAVGFSYPSTSYTINPITGQLEPTDAVPPEFFDFVP